MASVPPTNTPNPVALCNDPCCQQHASDQALIRGARDLAHSYKEGEISRSGWTGRSCAAKAPEMATIADRFERYGKAIPSARAANNLNKLKDADSGDVTEQCLERLPLNALELNRALGIDSSSTNALTSLDLRDDTTGYRTAIYRSKADGRLIVVSRDTQPDSLVDWKTNIYNGDGKHTAQYESARKMANKLNAAGVQFDIGGYSKGGGIGQEMGLLSPNSNVYVFNSAGLPKASLERTGQANFESLEQRTSSFSAEGDFLTFMNETKDSQKDVENARFLLTHLKGETDWSMDPMKIEFLDPEHRALEEQLKIQLQSGNRNIDPVLQSKLFEKRGKLKEELEGKDGLYAKIEEIIRHASSNTSEDGLFPPVRSSRKETIPGSMSKFGWVNGASSANARFGKLVQHLMSNVLGPMEEVIKGDRETLEDFLKDCGL